MKEFVDYILAMSNYESLDLQKYIFTLSCFFGRSNFMLSYNTVALNTEQST